jgi:DNA-binding MurR/RpiR family transcriptional regulator
MLIMEKLQAQVDFSPTDQAIAAVIMVDPGAAVGQSMQELGDRAHSSHSAVNRFCKRLGFTGYRAFTLALQREVSQARVTPSDANFPFVAGDTLREATAKLTTLSVDAITNAQQRLEMPQLVRAVQLLAHAHRIFLYGHGDSSLLVQGFANKLSKINIYPVFADQFGESNWNSTNTTRDDCALLVSYRGQNRAYVQTMQYLRGRGVRTILITGRPDSPMAKLADVCLETPGDEYDFMKIGTITSQLAGEYVLNLVYAGIYAQNYDDHRAELKAKQGTLTTGLLAEDGGKQ